MNSLTLNHVQTTRTSMRDWRVLPVVWPVLLLIGMLAMSVPCCADGVINVHLDYKVILNPVNGLRPAGAADANIQNAVRDMNLLSATYLRGYRLVLDRIIEVGGIGSEPSRWYDINFFNAPADSAKSDLESAAEANPGLYQWVENAINVYITNGFCGGISSFPPTQEIVIIGECSAHDGQVQLHEFGHYFDLCHSQGCPCGGCASTYSNVCTCGGTSCIPADEFGVCATWPWSDEVDDTIEDLPCWDLNTISDHNFGVPYASLGTTNRARVDVAATNNMSYHHQMPLCNPIISLTEGQLDRMADALTLNTNRTHVRDGRTYFASPTGTVAASGISTNPFLTVASARDAVNPAGGDIIILRPGAFPDTVTINVSVTLRATRAGGVVIGGSVAPSRRQADAHLATRSTIELVEQIKAENPERFPTSKGTCGTTRP